MVAKCKLKSGSISFKNYFKQLPVPFKIYADFECILKTVECDSIKNNSSFTENTSHMFLVVLLTKLFVLIINSVKKLFFTEDKNAVYKFIEAILSEYSYCRKVIKKHFGKNLIVSQKKKKKDLN